ncbi:hypothetical protein ACQ86N_25605 [Puia sp. P3]|uniref:hypothetical protein n=1 Tax=Puia sp. P3 TaxID=3423952 RepID=UPI003D67F648
MKPYYDKNNMDTDNGAVVGDCPGGNPGIQHGSLTERFYRQRNQALFWFGHGEGSAALRGALLECLDSAAWLGLDSGRYRPGELRKMEELEDRGRMPGLRKGEALRDSIRMAAADRRFTAAAFDYFGDVLRGGGWIHF